jgi:hypothetical protein
MKNILIIVAIILGFGSRLSGQTMVGLSKDQVIAAVKKDHKDFHKDDSVIKQRFNYLKYVNGPRTRTWIIYFNDLDVCRSSKLVCDYSDLDRVLKEMNSKYSQRDESLWEFQAGSDTIQFELIKQEWYFTIRESKKTKEVL